MRNISVKYHDGRLSIAHDATLTLMPDHWLIHYDDDTDQLQSVRWELDNITADQNFTTLYIFRHGSFPQQILETREEHFPEILKEYYPSRVFFEKNISAFFGKNNTLLITFTLLVLAFLGCAYWFVLPFVAEKVAATIPQSMETELGESLYHNVIAGYKINDTLTTGVNDFANSIDFKTAYPIKITVVQEQQANAFALPGGHIIVFDHLLNGMRTKEELAALLAHEVAHIQYRHSLKSMARSLAGYLFVSLIIGDVNGIAAVLADNSNMLLNLTYSRKLETQADQRAMQALQSEGISLKGFVDLFELLENQSGSPVTPGILSTHPLTGQRIQAAKAAAREQTNIRDNSGLQLKWLRLGIN